MGGWGWGAPAGGLDAGGRMVWVVQLCGDPQLCGAQREWVQVALCLVGFLAWDPGNPWTAACIAAAALREGICWACAGPAGFGTARFVSVSVLARTGQDKEGADHARCVSAHPRGGLCRPVIQLQGRRQPPPHFRTAQRQTGRGMAASNVARQGQCKVEQG